MNSNSSPKRQGICFIISAPSGSGKSTLIQKLIREVGNLEFIVSYTTRPPRQGEENGIAYHFVDDATFSKMLAAGEFLEWATVHGQRYGTPKANFLHKIDQGVDIILEIDVQGAAQIRQQFPAVVNIFILPGSPPELKNRLEKRGKDTPEVIAQRLETAKSEIQHLKKYDFLIINQQLETAANELKSIVVAERCRLAYRQQLVDSWNQAAKNWV